MRLVHLEVCMRGVEVTYSAHDNGLLVGCIECSSNPQRRSRRGICEGILRDALRFSQPWLIEYIQDILTDKECCCEAKGECLRYMLVVFVVSIVMGQLTSAMKQNQSSAFRGCRLCFRATNLRNTTMISRASITAVTTTTVVGDCVAINMLSLLEAVWWSMC
jgi:hypothetical protein